MDSKEYRSKFQHFVTDFALTEEEKVWARLSGKTESRFRMEKLLSRINPPNKTKEKNNENRN